MLYFKRHWNEKCGSMLTNSWGACTYYFETDNNMNVKTQLQVYHSGKMLKYDEQFLEDKFGGLSKVKLDRKEFLKYSISKNDFSKVNDLFLIQKFST